VGLDSRASSRDIIAKPNLKNPSGLGSRRGVYIAEGKLIP